ncbi:unnamed protein product, partial [Chrysoparadoxa australica]
MEQRLERAVQALKLLSKMHTKVAPGGEDAHNFSYWSKLLGLEQGSTGRQRESDAAALAAQPKQLGKVREIMMEKGLPIESVDEMANVFDLFDHDNSGTL